MKLSQNSTQSYQKDFKLLLVDLAHMSDDLLKEVTYKSHAICQYSTYRVSKP